MSILNSFLKEFWKKVIPHMKDQVDSFYPQKISSSTNIKHTYWFYLTKAYISSEGFLRLNFDDITDISFLKLFNSFLSFRYCPASFKELSLFEDVFNVSGLGFLILKMLTIGKRYKILV